ncbi:MAG: acyl--CoA ligase [Gammaproteobacteria bacterium]
MVAAELYEVLDGAAGSAPAILAPAREALTHGALRDRVERAIHTLRRVGIDRDDRVAMVLPNGAEMAVAFLAVSVCATAAPLNPAYRRKEFEFYLNDLKPRALLTLRGSDSAAVEVARELNIALLEIIPQRRAPAGAFELAPVESTIQGGFAPASKAKPAQADDIALVLHTSGTTSRPKLVPLSQRNLCASAAHIRASLALSAQDRGLNIMPLFHIHGLIAALLAPLAAGGSVFCTPGFNALKFFDWFEQAQPTWYTAVPTMHQAILARARRHRAQIAAAPLRFIRSSSASLPARVLRELEATFRAPVIESYGMTEAAHQMASNPLPPRPRVPGSVGIAAGPEIAIMDENGSLLPAGTAGEVVIRGPNVMCGYENNPQANALSFANGWFRTGDQGVLDEDGYLRLTGRLKEIINRGGEKISPREIDEVLMDHPAVLQAVAFAVPHTGLGEEVGAAVVLREHQNATATELRKFAAARLADYKVPRKIVVVTEIPKGPTGKLQRIGLASKLGLA